MWKFCSLVCFLAISTSSSPPEDRDVAPCLRKFYSAVYNASYNCTSDFDFSSENSTIQQKALINGKTCFLEVVKSECTPIQYDELDSEYDYFVEILTTTPSGEEDTCDNPYYQFHGQKCVALLSHISLRNKELYPIPTKINDSRVVRLIEQCEEAEECIKPVCLSTEAVKSAISSACESLRMKNSEFMACQFQLDGTPLDRMNFACLGGFDFFGNTLETEIQKFSSKKECTKEIMERNCGKKSVEKFDYYSGQMLKMLEIARDDEEDGEDH